MDGNLKIVCVTNQGTATPEYFTDTLVAMKELQARHGEIRYAYKNYDDMGCMAWSFTSHEKPNHHLIYLIEVIDVKGERNARLKR